MIDRIRSLLRLLAVNQAEFAEAGGIQRTTLANWLAGKGTPTQPVMEAWVKKYGLNGHWLLTGEGEVLAGICAGAQTTFERDMQAFTQMMKKYGAKDEELRKGLLALAVARGKEPD